VPPEQGPHRQQRHELGGEQDEENDAGRRAQPLVSGRARGVGLRQPAPETIEKISIHRALIPRQAVKAL
jgi:hypothetical protein